MLTTLQIGAILAILAAFGVEPSIISQVSTELQPHVATTTQQASQNTQPIQTPSEPNLGATTPVINTPVVDTPAPVVQSVVMNPPTISSISIDQGILHVTSFEKLNISDTILPEGVTLGDVQFDDKAALINRNGKLTRDGHGYGVKLNGLPPLASEVSDGEQANSIDITLVGSDGGEITKSVVVR